MGRPPRENVTPKVLEKAVWVGTNLAGYANGAAALGELAGVELSAKQIQRMTSRIGQDRAQERTLRVETFRAKPLAARTAAPRGAEIPELGVVMMDGGRHRRRDEFGRQDHNARGARHWKENKVGLVLSMAGETFAADPAPEFPEWLAGAKVVSEIAEMAASDEAPENGTDPTHSGFSGREADEEAQDHDARSWSAAPKPLRREMIASTAEAESFGWHLEQKAWREGLSAAPRGAFVADGAAVNWTIHRKHFSQMTGVLDLMHALSYAHRAARAFEEPGTYRRWAAWIWGGEVQRVIRELQAHQRRFGAVEPKPENAHDPRDHVARALTYYKNHQHRMNYPEYRRDGLPLTSSHVESAIKQVNQRVKGSEKFWRAENAEAILQLRADSLSDSRPLSAFWTRWRTQQNGANRYCTTAS